MDFNQIAQSIIADAGDTSNISSVTRCSTRLSLSVNDRSKVDTGKIEKTKPVIGVVFNGDELPVILGKNLIPVYTEVSKLHNEAGGGSAGAKAKEKLTFKGVVDMVVGFVSASVMPLIPGLVAGGMMKVFLLLITLAAPAFEESQLYSVLSMAANIPFYFMPIFVAYGASKKLGSTPLYAMTVAGLLLYPQFMELIGGEVPVTLLGIPVMAVKYNSTMLPALLIALCAHYIEKLLTKIIPGILRSVFLGMLTISITTVFGITILGPLGDLVGSKVVNVFLFASEHFDPVAIGLLAACMPWLVMTGMHHAVTPFMVQAFADPGYDVFFRPSYILHNMAEGGACLGVAIRAKNKRLKAECLSLAFGCIVAGVTKPAIYGVNFRLRKPMAGVMAGAAVGDVIAGIFGATAYVYGYSTILALPIFEHTVGAMAAAIAVAIIVAAIVTALLGFDETLVVTEEDEGAAPAIERGKVENTTSELVSCVTGKTIDLSEVNDGVFSERMLGDGIAVVPTGEEIVAPTDGTVCAVAETGHAVGLQLDNGVQLLIHIGLDTVAMKGKGFNVKVKNGQHIKRGDKMVAFNRKEN